MIRAEKWDFVVIQEIFNAREQEFQDYAAKFDDLIRQCWIEDTTFRDRQCHRILRCLVSLPGRVQETERHAALVRKDEGNPGGCCRVRLDEVSRSPALGTTAA